MAPFGAYHTQKVLETQFDSVFYDSICNNVILESNESGEYFGDDLSEDYYGLLTFGMDDPQLREAQAFNDGKHMFRASEFKNEDFAQCDDCYFNIESFVEQVNSGKLTNAKITTISGKSFMFPKVLCSRYFGEDNKEKIAQKLIPTDSVELDYQVVARADGKPIVVSFIHPNGSRYTLCSTPLMFSNYALSYDNYKGAGMIKELLVCSGFKSPNSKGSNVSLLPFIMKSYNGAYNHNDYYYTTDFVDERANTSESEWNNDGDFSVGFPFFEILKEMAKIILFFVLGVFCVFIIRRRQRAIPVIDGYVNRTADYARQVGLLYLNDGDYSIVLKNSIVIFFKDVEERLHIQLSDESHVVENADILAAAIGTPGVKLSSFIEKGIDVINGSIKVSEQFLIYYSDIINLMAKALRGDMVQVELQDLLKIRN